MITIELVDTQRLGFVYVLERPDLMICYVGQSIRDTRPAMHLKPGTYQYNELHQGGAAPAVSRTESLFLHGEELNEAERSEMRRRVAAGWTLVNRLGPDNQWPLVPFESASAGGKKGGKAMVQKGFAVSAANDPEEHAAKSSKGALAGKARRAIDPVYMEAFKKSFCAAGAETRRNKRATDPAWVKQEKENARKGGLIGGRNGGRATAKVRVKCLECGKISTPGGIGSHQKSSDHAGRTTISGS